MYKEIIYDMVTCQSIYECIDVNGEKISINNEYKELYDRLIEEIYRCKNNILERLDEDENEDMEIILNNFMELSRIGSYKMYDIVKKIYKFKEC